MIVSDNGTEYTSNAILGWADETGVGWHYIAPGKPQQNGYNERPAKEITSVGPSGDWRGPACPDQEGAGLARFRAAGARQLAPDEPAQLAHHTRLGAGRSRQAARPWGPRVERATS